MDKAHTGNPTSWDSLDTARLHDVALLADDFLTISRMNDSQTIAEQASETREANISVACDAAGWLISKEADLANADPALRQTVVSQLFGLLVERRGQPDFHLDELTGLQNRKAFSIVEPIAEHDPAKKFIMFDANNFKKINDTYGHAAGDAILGFLGACFRDISEELGIAAAYRVGGDEFVIISDASKAEQVLFAYESRIMQQLKDAHTLCYANDRLLETADVLKLEFSLIGGHGDTAHEADMHMYQRKRASKAERQDS